MQALLLPPLRELAKCVDISILLHFRKENVILRENQFSKLYIQILVQITRGNSMLTSMYYEHLFILSVESECRHPIKSTKRIFENSPLALFRSNRRKKE